MRNYWISAVSKVTVAVLVVSMLLLPVMSPQAQAVVPEWPLDSYLQATTTEGQPVELAWSTVTGVTYYQIYEDGLSIGQVVAPITSYTVNVPAHPGTLEYSVKALTADHQAAAGGPTTNVTYIPLYEPVAGAWGGTPELYAADDGGYRLFWSEAETHLTHGSPIGYNLYMENAEGQVEYIDFIEYSDYPISEIAMSQGTYLFSVQAVYLNEGTFYETTDGPTHELTLSDGLMIETYGSDAVYIPLDSEFPYGLEVIAPNNGVVFDLQWSSSDETVAVVDQDGYVTPLQIGRTTITLSANNGAITDSADLYVYESLTEPPLTISTKKGIAGEDEYVAVTISRNAQAIHDIQAFEIIFSANPEVWQVYGAAPAPDVDLEAPLEVTAPFFPGHILMKGKLSEGGAVTGTDELVTVYLKATPDALLPPFEPLNMEESGSFGLFDSMTIDSGDIAHAYFGIVLGDVPIANPDVDGDGAVTLSDYEAVVAALGQTVVSELDEWHAYDFNRNQRIDIHDVTFVRMRVLYPNFDPDAPGEDVIEPVEEPIFLD